MTTVNPTTTKLGSFFPKEYQNLVHPSKKRKIKNVRDVRDNGRDYSNDELTVKYWKLTQMSGGDAFLQIKDFTQMKIKDSDFSMEDMGNRLIRNDFLFRGFMYAPTDDKITRRVIGENGYFFKITTEYTNINFIWHDRSKNIFYFWGHKENVIKAMNKIYERCVNQTKIVNSTNEM